MEYIQRPQQLQVLALFGTVDYVEGHDAKAQRDLASTPLAAECFTTCPSLHWTWILCATRRTCRSRFIQPISGS